MSNSSQSHSGVYCETCKTELTYKQVSKARNKGSVPRYCSYACSVKANVESLQEPETAEEAATFEKTIKSRRSIMMGAEERLVHSLTPIDNSPESEKKLRQAVCPNPSYAMYNSRISQKYSTPTSTVSTNHRKAPPQ